MQRCGDDPGEPQCDGAGKNRNRDIALLNHLFPQIERRRLREDPERYGKNNNAENGEE